MDKAIVAKIMAIMESNPYAVFFRSLRELPSIEDHNIVLRSDPCLDQRVYNLPTTDHVAAIWHQLNDSPSARPHEIRVYTHLDKTHYIQYYYGCYDPLQYPLLFPYGEPGWHVGIKRIAKRGPHTGVANSTSSRGQPAVLPHLHRTGEELLQREQQSMSHTLPIPILMVMQHLPLHSLVLYTLRLLHWRLLLL